MLHLNLFQKKKNKDKQLCFLDVFSNYSMPRCKKDIY